MRRLIGIIGAMVVIGTLYVVPAQANGTCTAVSHKPVNGGGGRVDFAGHIDCGAILHKISVFADLYRRSPGGAWLWWDDSQAESLAATRKTATGTSSGYNCAKDYKVITEGFAIDLSGNFTHTGLQDLGSSKIFTHTC